MIAIDLLKNHPEAINALAEIHYEALGKIWFPERPIRKTIENLANHLNDHKLPLTFVAFDKNIPVGMCSLRVDDGLNSKLTPWLGSLARIFHHNLSYKKCYIANALISCGY